MFYIVLFVGVLSLFLVLDMSFLGVIVSLTITIFAYFFEIAGSPGVISHYIFFRKVPMYLSGNKLLLDKECYRD